MLNFTVRSLLTISFLFLGGITAANAQANGSTIRANIPHDFVLRDKTFPAGDYTIQRTYSTADSPSLLVIQGEDQSAVFDTMTSTSNKAAKNTELVFDLADGVYFLSKIRVKGSETGSEVVRTRSESKQIASARSEKSVTVGP